jgi:hypothetical protein
MTLTSCILDIAKIESGEKELQSQSYRTSELIWELSETGAAGALKNGLSFETDADESLP